MKLTRPAALLFAMTSIVLSVATTEAALIPSADGLTVYDTVLHVTWLANANLAGTDDGHFGVARIAPNGAMDYAATLQWVAALNGLNGGAGYLGHNDWQLPATPAIDSTCASMGLNGNSFGIGCMNSTMGSLYYQSLGLTFPDSAVPIRRSTVGPFTNFRPYLYWSGTTAADSSQGYIAFSFNNGWEGANVTKHYMYALPMINGRLPGTPVPAGNGLQASADGKTV